MVDFDRMSPAGRAAALRAKKRAKQKASPLAQGDFRAESEDDDGYDPYSDYMDALARSGYEQPEEDPWR